MTESFNFKKEGISTGKGFVYDIQADQGLYSVSFDIDVGNAFIDYLPHDSFKNSQGRKTSNLSTTAPAGTFTAPNQAGKDETMFEQSNGGKFLVRSQIDGTVSDVYTDSAFGATDGAYDGTYVYFANTSSTFVYGYNPENNMNREFRVKRVTGGIGHDGRYFWGGRGGNIYQFDKNGNYIENFPHAEPDTSSTGAICWDGNYVAHGSRTSASIYRYTSSGKLVEQFKLSPSPDTRFGGADGLSWDGRYYYWTNENTSMIYWYDSKGDFVNYVKTKFPQANGFVWTGKYGYCIDNSINTVYRMTSSRNLEVRYRILGRRFE